LLAVVKLHDGSPVVQFAHFSVKEYLTSARLAKAKDSICRFHVSMTPAHTIVVQACLGALLHLDENITKDSLENFPLARYAAEHWVSHTRFENVSSNVQDGIKRLFDPNKGHISVLIWAENPDYTWLQSNPSRFERPVKALAIPLHYVAWYGMHDVAAFLIAEHSQDVNACDLDGEAPLHVASHSGHADIAQLLLENGADVEAQDDDERTPLILASLYGYVEVARVLLEHGADTEARDEGGESSLELASLVGHTEVARVLLEHGANANAQNKDKQAPLHFARGEKVARFLLKHGADANALDMKGRTPLHHASKDGSVGAAWALLEHGVDANARDANNATPLHLASQSRFSGGRHPDIIRLLLQYGSDIHARNNKGQTPFMMATEVEDHAIMQLLSEYGAEDHKTRI
jgi:ankyrin repeat protein